MESKQKQVVTERPGNLAETMGLRRPFWMAASLSDLGLTAEEVVAVPELKRIVEKYAQPCVEADWWLAGGNLQSCPKHKRRFTMGRCPGHVDRIEEEGAEPLPRPGAHGVQ